MKKISILCFLSLILIVNHSLGQSDDKQWFIFNGLGKNGVTGNNNNYVATNSIGTEFTLYGVKSPNKSANTNASNDLFIIYANGEHYNGSIPNISADYPTVTSHKIKTTGQGNVKFMYLTNRYEGDDLPPGVKAMAIESPAAQKTYPTINATQTSIAVNHTIVAGKDITVIVNYDSFPGPEPLVVSFDGVEPIGGGAPVYGYDILDLKPAFGATLVLKEAIYPIPASDPGTNESITLEQATGRYRYINLRPNQNINLIPVGEKGKPLYQAVFELRKGGVFKGRAVAPIGAAHDPNFLQVKSICKQNDGSFIISYNLEFENDGTGPATKLRAEVFFPPQFDLDCLDAKSWRAAGSVCKGNTSSYIKIAKFDFKNHNKLEPKHVDPSKSKGGLNFRVKVNPGYDVTDVSNSIRPDSILVYFDSNSFPLNDFRDLIKCDRDKSDDDSQEAMHKDSINEEKMEKEKKASKMAKPVRINCYRPLSNGKCKCGG